MDPIKVDAVKTWPELMSIKQLQSFLGFYNYYNHFIKDYSKIIAPLTRLSQKEAKFIWGESLQMAFDELRLALTSAPILCMPYFEKPFNVHVDTSDITVGAVLTQQYDGLDMPVCYYSKRLNDTESRWSIYERELYAILQALSKWRRYLINRHTVIYTDHQPLKYFISQSKLSAKQQCWLDFVADFSLDVQYKPGAQNILQDALYRLPEQARYGSCSGSA